MTNTFSKLIDRILLNILKRHGYKVEEKAIIKEDYLGREIEGRQEAKILELSNQVRKLKEAKPKKLDLSERIMKEGFRLKGFDNVKLYDVTGKNYIGTIVGAYLYSGNLHFLVKKLDGSVSMIVNIDPYLEDKKIENSKGEIVGLRINRIVKDGRLVEIDPAYYEVASSPRVFLPKDEISTAVASQNQMLRGDVATAIRNHELAIQSIEEKINNITSLLNGIVPQIQTNQTQPQQKQEGQKKKTKNNGKQGED